MKQLLGLLIVAFFLSNVSLAQEKDFFHDKLPFEEGKSYLKKINFVEDESYSDSDLTFQRMEWIVDPAVHYIAGGITSYFQVKTDNFSSIKFDLINQLQVDSVVYHGEKINFTHNNNKLDIQFANAISNGANDSIAVWYHGAPLSSGFGAFQAQNTPAGDPVLWTLSEPYGAMEWWPCKQSLVDKIDSIEIIVSCPVGNRVGSNGKLISEITDGDQRIVKWKHKHPIVTYLVAIAVSNYASFSDFVDLEDGSQIEILNYVYPASLSLAENQLSASVEIMELFNSLIGDYPFADEKYGHAQFGWGGGMEHQTMSFMGGFSYSLVAHEMAHQWFGDYITLGSWKDIWLNEGFATYFEGLTNEHLKTEADWMDWKEVRVEYITRELGGSVYVDDTTSVNRIFNGRLSYAKGAYLLHMLRWELGDEVFFDAIRNYYNDPNVANGFASNQELVSHLEAAGDTTLTEFFDDWYYGQGYPSYQVNHSTNMGNNGAYELTIQQNTSHSSVDFFEMHVPFRAWKNGISTDLRLHQTTNPQTFTLAEKSDSIQFDPDLWLISKNSLVTDVEQLPVFSFQIFPNPAKDKLFVRLSALENIQSIKIIDLFGRSVIERNQLVSSQIDISELSDGSYFILIETNQSSYRERFIKAK